MCKKIPCLEKFHAKVFEDDETLHQQLIFNACTCNFVVILILFKSYLKCSSMDLKGNTDMYMFKAKLNKNFSLLFNSRLIKYIDIN